MSFTLLSSVTRKARKQHRCIWCTEPIEMGDKYTHEKSVYDGYMQDHKWHPECLGANADYHREEGESEFEAHSFARGTTHEAGLNMELRHD